MLILVLMASLVAGSLAAENSSKPKPGLTKGAQAVQDWIAKRPEREEAMRAEARAKITNDFLQPELSPEKVKELTQTRDNLTAETKQWPRALKLDLMMRIAQKREELALLEHQLNECERAIGSEKFTSVQHQGATFKFCEPHVETLGPLEQMLRKILGFHFYTKPEASGRSRYETNLALGEEMHKFNLESSNFRYNIRPSEPGAPTPFAFTAVYNHVTQRLAKIHYIQKILDDHVQLNRCVQSIDSYLNGGRGGVSYSTQESFWESLLQGKGAIGECKGPVCENASVMGFAHSVAFLRQRISQALIDQPKVLAV